MVYKRNMTGRQIIAERNRQKKKKIESTERLRILDWYVHQGHQYEFFKLNHDFFLVGVDAVAPDWNQNHRPLRNNVYPISERRAFDMNFDIVMVRSPLNPKRYERFIRNGAIPVAVVQTTTPYRVSNRVENIVWNSYEVMDTKKHFYGKKRNHHILHGYDPNEFQNLNLKKNNRVLVVANLFKERADIMGYDIYRELLGRTKNLDLLGHGNEGVDNSIGQAESFEKLIELYNQYSIFLNTTLDSAMPRSRAEAAMCGMPIISTNNFGIGRYFSHKRNAIITNDVNEMEIYIKKFAESPAMIEDYGAAAREVAIKHFHIKDYLEKWEKVIRSL